MCVEERFSVRIFVCPTWLSDSDRMWWYEIGFSCVIVVAISGIGDKESFGWEKSVISSVVTSVMTVEAEAVFMWIGDVRWIASA